MRTTSFILLLMAVGIGVYSQRVTYGADPPNILFIYLDDFGWRDCGFMGSDFFETPNLDKLASQGMIFTNAYSCAANCAPARACLLSGQYTPRHEIYNVGTGARGNPKYRKLEHISGTDTLDPTIRTWAQQLQSAGYKTATVGKWHLSGDPIPYGFDLNIAGTHSGSPPNGYYPPHNEVPGIHDAAEGEYLTDRLTNEAVHFIQGNRNRRWALYLTHFAVHTPLDAKKELIPKYKAKAKGRRHKHVAMATMIQAVDDGVGRIQATLEELGLSEKTVILFSSDNGGYGPATDMTPLKGYKGTYYEGGIRVPFFIKWSGVVPARTSCSEPTIGVDIYPTLCDFAGAELPENQKIDGVSLVPLLTGQPTGLRGRPLFWHFPAYLQSYSVWNEQRDPLFRSRPCSIIRAGDWKLHQYFEDSELELYNLRDDIGESRNLAAHYPSKVAELLDQLKQWRRDVDAPVPTRPNPKYDPDAEKAAISARTNELRRKS